MKIHNGEKSIKCNQCDFVSYQAGDLRKHLEAHCREKLNKYSQCECEYASSDLSALRTHVKSHFREKSDKCSQFDYSSFRRDKLKTHLKTGGEEKLNKYTKPSNLIFRKSLEF